MEIDQPLLTSMRTGGSSDSHWSRWRRLLKRYPGQLRPKRERDETKNREESRRVDLLRQIVRTDGGSEGIPNLSEEKNQGSNSSDIGVGDFERKEGREKRSVRRSRSNPFVRRLRRPTSSLRGDSGSDCSNSTSGSLHKLTHDQLSQKARKDQEREGVSEGRSSFRRVESTHLERSSVTSSRSDHHSNTKQPDKKTKDQHVLG